MCGFSISWEADGETGNLVVQQILLLLLLLSAIGFSPGGSG
jgi:hypothetical protein